MSKLKDFFNKLFRKNKLALPESKEINNSLEKQEAERIITIELLESIINGNYSLDISKNSDFNIKVKNALKDYCIQMKNYGYVFKEEQLSNIRRVLGDISKLFLKEDNDRTENIVTIDFLKKILEDATTFDNFLHFKENKDLFPHFTEEEYVAKLNEVYDSFSNNTNAIYCIDPRVIAYIKNYQERKRDTQFKSELTSASNQDTIRFVPIDILDRIIQDKNITDTLLTNGSYLDMSIQDLSQILKDYCDLMLKYGHVFSATETENLSKLLNMKIPQSNSQTKIEANSTNITPYNISFFKELFTNEELFLKFVDMEHNRTIFGDFSKEEYINSLNEFVDSCKMHAIDLKLSSNLLDYLSKTKSLESFGSRLPNDVHLNEDLSKAVLDAIPDGVDSFTKAYIIYDELNKRLHYDSNYGILAKKLHDKDKMSAIYNMNVADITLDNNAITCKSYCEICSELFREVGIDSVINIAKRVGSHRFVTANVDGKLVTFDSTNLTENSDDNTSLPDTARGKLNLPYAGITGINMDISNELTNARQLAISNQSEKAHSLDSVVHATLSDKYEEKIESEILGTSTLAETFDKKINMINTIISGNVEGIEAISVFNNLSSAMFSKEEMKTSSMYSIAILNNDTYTYGKVISFSDSSLPTPAYYVLLDGKFVKMDYQELSSYFEKGTFKEFKNEKVQKKLQNISQKFNNEVR